MNSRLLALALLAAAVPMPSVRGQMPVETATENQNIGNWLEWENDPGTCLEKLFGLPPKVPRTSGLSFTEWQALNGGWLAELSGALPPGLTPYAVYTSALLSNVAGGLGQGANLNGLLEFGTYADSEKLMGLHGGTFHLSFLWYHGQGISSNLVGVLPTNGVNGLAAAPSIRVYQINWRQVFADDRASLRIGQVVLGDDFMLTSYSNLFQNEAFGQMPPQQFVSNAPVYPLAAPGATLCLDLPEEWFFRTGAYVDNAGLDVSTNHGFGWQWGGSSGAAVPVEIGRGYEIAGLKGKTTLGGMWDTGIYATFSQGTPVTGNGVAWLMVEQELARDAQGSPLLAVFARAAYAPISAITGSDTYLDGGLNWFGPLAARPNDTFGIAANVTHYTPGFRQASTALTGTLPPAAQGTIEVTYAVQISPFLLVQPDIQVIVNPFLGGDTACSFNLFTTLTF